MNRFRLFWSRCAGLFHRQRFERELREELEFHFGAEVDHQMRNGLNRAEAERQARKKFGGVQQTKEACRDTLAFPAIDAFVRDLRHGLRGLAGDPGFTITAVLTLAIGIGVTTTLFSVFYGVLLRPLPWPDAEQLVRVEERRGGFPSTKSWTLTNGTYNAWLEAQTTVQGVGGWMSSSQTLLGSGDPERVLVVGAAPGLFRILEARPELGRLFTDEDSQPGQRGTAILSFGLWQERFGGDTNVLGQTIQLDGRAFDIVGIMPRGFAFPDRATRVWTPFRPLPMVSPDGRQISVIPVETIARLRPGVTPATVEAEVTARARSGGANFPALELAYFGSTGEPSAAVAPLQDLLTAESRPVLVVLMSAAVLLLIASTGSVVSIQLARATARWHDTAVRQAMGAKPWHLVQQSLVESALLGLCAGGVGIALSGMLHQILPAILPADFPRVDAISLDSRIALFLVAVTVGGSVVCGALPSLLLRRAKLNIAGSLSEDAAATSGMSLRTTAARMRTSIMIGQVALTCMLVIGTGLLGRSLQSLTLADRGYDPTNLLTARLTFPHDHELSSARSLQIIEALQERLQSLPGVTQAGFGQGLPLVASGTEFNRDLPSRRDSSVTMNVSAQWRVVSPEYLSALRLRLISGRSFTTNDTASSVGVIVVNRTFATRYLGDTSIGPRLQFDMFSRLEWEVVGVVDDLSQGDPGEPPQPEFFLSYRQAPEAIPFDPMLVLRTEADPAAYTPAIRSMIRDLDSSLVLDSVMTMRDRVATSLAAPRLYALLFAVFAISGLLIAGVSLFGMLAHNMALRYREIGIRVAMGATMSHVVTLVLRQAAIIVGTGLVVGIAATLIAAESLSTILYGITTRDPISYLLASLVVALVGTIACVGPASKAARIDPWRTLRSG